MKEVGGWFLHFFYDSLKDYFINVNLKCREIAGRTLLFFDFNMDSPRFAAMGIRMTRFPPPLAAQIGSIKFWNQLQIRLNELGIAPPRRRTSDEHKLEVRLVTPSVMSSS